MTDPTPMDHLKALEALDAGGPATVSLHRIEKAVQWALPLLRAMREAPSNPHLSAHVGAIERMLTSKPIKEDDQKGALEWALPILRAYAIRKMTTPPTKNTPGSNVHNLRLLATGESVAWDLVETALDWALPILEASMATAKDREELAAWFANMSKWPIGSSATMTEEAAAFARKAANMIRVPSDPENISRSSISERNNAATDLELAADDLAKDPHPTPIAMSSIRKIMREAASMLRVQTPINSRYSDQHRQAVSSFLKKASSDPKMPDSAARMYMLAIEIIEAPMSPPSEAQHQINRLSEFMTAYTATHHQTWEVSEGPVDVAIRLLSMKSTESMAEHADKLRKMASDATASDSNLRSELREAAMILQGLGISFEELAKLESFIEEKFPGELDGNGPATVAIRLLTLLRPESPLAATCPGCEEMFLDSNTIPKAKRAWICGTCELAGLKRRTSLRLPTLDASQIPVTRDLALEVLRGFFASMQREYPYAPNPTAELWATTREALIVVLAHNQEDHPPLFSERKKAQEVVNSVVRERDLVDAELRTIQSILGCKVDELPVATADRISRELKDARSEAERYQAYWNASATRLSETMAILGIEAPFPETSKLRSAIEEKWFKKCRPGTMNMMPVRCDACTAPAGTVHLPIPEAPTSFLKEALEKADLFRSQREVAWKELREIREAIGANPEESTLDEVKRLMSAKEQQWESLKQSRDEISAIRNEIGAKQEETTLGVVKYLLALKQWERSESERCSQGRNVVGPYQCRTCCALPGNPHNPESVTTRYAPIIRETMDLARRGERLHRERLPLLASALDLALSAMGRSIIVTETTDTAEEMTETESYGWAHQAIRPMVRAQTEVHLREQVLDLVASAVREAWARRRFSGRGPSKA